MNDFPSQASVNGRFLVSKQSTPTILNMPRKFFVLVEHQMFTDCVVEFPLLRGTGPSHFPYLSSGLPFMLCRNVCLRPALSFPPPGFYDV